MMKRLIIFIICFSCCKFIAAQSLVSANKPAGGNNTYALIIGVASYVDPEIPQLQYANRDAEFFADFLMSEPGGSVPKEQIKLLIDSVATTGEIEKALVWLKDNCKKNDNVFFYFSGHGALENVTMYNNGYLLSYNTPSVAFVNFGFSIERLNDVANTLSVNNKANVIIITDACHSGKMAGSKFKGNYLVGEQLMAVKQKEIRMASSATDQLSNEKADWGGGRGVFSYHLLNGLQGGLADKGNDGIVTLGELKTYMESAMANDQVLKNEGEVQTPVIKGNQDFPLSRVVEAESIKTRQQVQDDSLSNAMVFATMNEEENLADPEEYFFSLLKKENLETLTENLKLDSLAPGDIAFVLINQWDSIRLSAAGLNKLKELESLLKNDSENLKRFNLSLGRAINDKGQEVILQYIKGDEAELERRRYYNSNSNGYDIYPKMFAAALKLSAGDQYLSNSTAVLLHYFKGVTLRLKIPLTKDPKPLIKQAFSEQKKALALEEHAAYIYNELGILYQLKKDYTAAEKNFTKATQFSPRWALPHSNLCGLYGLLKEYDKALAACNTADSLQMGLQSVSASRGFVYERMGNLLFAEEFYRQAIEINDRHYIPFERLGNIYMNTTDYVRADSFFYEAELRKKGYHFTGNWWERVPAGFVASPDVPMICDIDEKKLKPTDIFAFFTLGVQAYGENNYEKAITDLKKVVALDKKNPLVYHYLGKIYFDQKQWEPAELMFKYAMDNYMDDSAFTRYVDSVKSSVTYPYDHDCIDQFFVSNYYEGIEDLYFTGTLHEAWKHAEESEMYFKKIIQTSPNELGGYIKLWRLYETLGRYTEAEAIIKSYAHVDKERADRELNTFYRRTIEKLPDNGEWNYRLGLLLYSRAVFAAKAPYLDSIVLLPKVNKELFIDFDMFHKLDTTEDLSIFDLASTGSTKSVVLESVKELTVNFVIPGTKELIMLADPIYTPRKDGINYLSRAAELLSEKETLADISFKIGNIYLWAGSKKQAYPYFEKSLELIPDNVNARLTLVDIYTVLFKNRAALYQLNYLYDSSQINFQKRLLLSQFNIHAGQFEKANAVLDKAEAIHPYPLPGITDLRGRLNMLANKTKDAIIFYQNYAKTDAKNPVPAYTIARLYAKTGKTSEALKWLETAINYGFNYSFVLQNDPFMDNLRKTGKWQKLTQGITMKEYPANFRFN